MALSDLGISMPSGGGVGGMFSMTAMIALGALGLGCAIGFLWWVVKRKKNWNIKVEFRLPRDVKEIKEEDGSTKVAGTITKEWGKGYYDSKRGAVFVKRKKAKPVAMKPFNIKEALSGKKGILTVMQVGIEDYRPVIEDSYLNVVDSETGEEAALINAKIDTSESKSWARTFERETKGTYTVLGWLHEYGQLVGFGFIVLCMFVGFAIVYAKV